MHNIKKVKFHVPAQALNGRLDCTALPWDAWKNLQETAPSSPAWNLIQEYLRLDCSCCDPALVALQVQLNFSCPQRSPLVPSVVYPP